MRLYSNCHDFLVTVNLFSLSLHTVVCYSMVIWDIVLSIVTRSIVWCEMVAWNSVLSFVPVDSPNWSVVRRRRGGQGVPFGFFLFSGVTETNVMYFKHLIHCYGNLDIIADRMKKWALLLNRYE